MELKVISKEEIPENLRFSGYIPKIEEQVNEFQARGRSSLTQSQKLRLELELESFVQMKRDIGILLQYYSDQEERAKHLLDFHDRISEILKFYNVDEERMTSFNEDETNLETTRFLRQSGIIQDFQNNENIHMEKKQEKEKEKEKEEEEETQVFFFECPICYLDFPSSDCFTLNCGHIYCTSCLTSYFQEKMSSGRVLDIVCPNPQCSLEIEEEKVSSFLDSNLFSKFQRFRFLASLQQDPNCRWCSTPGCETPIIVDPNQPNFPQFTCPECQQNFCFHCGLSWHSSIMEYEKFCTKNNLRTCKKCGFVIEWVTGCNFITCRCGYKFCFYCGTPGKGGWAPGCQCRPGHGFQEVDSILNNWNRPPNSNQFSGIKPLTLTNSEPPKSARPPPPAKTSTATGVMKNIGKGIIAVPVVILGVAIAIPCFLIGAPPYVVYKYVKNKK